MIITNTVTKKVLENIVHQTFSKFGLISSSSLLDSLKFLGFYYATAAGISINIEDLKTPDIKKKYISTANLEIDEISQKWQEGFVSDTERFQTIIDSWNIATESLKNRIVEYYQNYDPANNLYIMAFSGARGNMSQVRQLVGMRGLMSDQEGKIIDLPIQANFREGLSSIDYIISSYGARKGIVDTALKTADSGYLTRRLIYIAQDLIIREKNCGTNEGIIFLLKKNTNIKNVLGRSLISTKSNSFKTTEKEKNFQILDLKTLSFLKEKAPLFLNIRSSLTCKSTNSICQNCYGWDLSHGKLISLGEAVGIIAAQSIGEPGTQLTMRTFHTGGIFTGELVKQILSPFSGKLILPKELKTIPYRTNHGMIVLKLQQEIVLTLINWKGISKEIFLDIGSYLYINQSSFVRKDQLLAEYMTQSILPGGRRLKPVISNFSGEIRFENLLVRKMFRDKRTIKVNQDDGIVWIAQGKTYSFPKEAAYLEPFQLNKKNILAQLKIIAPYQGIINFNSSKYILKGLTKTFSLDINQLKLNISNCFSQFNGIVKNYQYIDSYSVLGYINFFPSHEGTIYSIRKKDSKYTTVYFLITESDIWKIYSDQVKDFSLFSEKKIVVRSGNLVNLTARTQQSGFFLKRDGFKMIFQTALPVFLSRGTILNYKQGDFISKKKILATLVNYTQQTEDIVQGLPKIEELIEARRPKIKSYLAFRPGIFLNSNLFEGLEINNLKRYFNKNIIQCIFSESIIAPPPLSKRKQEKQIIYISHSIFLKDNFVIFKNKIFRILPIPSIFKPKPKLILKKGEYIPKKGEFVFKNFQNETLLIKGKAAFSIWEPCKFLDLKEKKTKDLFILKFQNKNLEPFLTIINGEKGGFVNKKGDLALLTKERDYVFLEYLNPIVEYELPLTAKVIFEPGNFVDIGEPITEGIIDVHELFHIFFQYHSVFDGMMKGAIRSLHKFQLLLVNSIQSIYQSQGVNISSKHIEIIVRQMTSKAVIRESGDTPLLPGELIRLSLITEIYKGLKLSETKFHYKTPNFEPILLSATTSSLSKDGFLSSAGFQETKRVLTKAALEGSSDWLRGLKECIIIGRLIPAGSAFLNYKNYLDNIYLFKNE